MRGNGETDNAGSDADREDIHVELTSIVWQAMDAGFDRGEVYDAIDQAINTWEPDDEDSDDGTF